VAALTYDSFGLLFEALRKAPRPNARRCATRWRASRATPASRATFALRPASGDPIKSAVIMQVKGDHFTWVMNAAP
jgi:branched-chain amino acid transport system substrate-binding protein